MFNLWRPGLLEKIACYGWDDPYVLVIRNKFGGCDSALLYKLLKKSMECYFCPEFLYIFFHHIHMGFTCSKRLFISLHFAKNARKSIKWEQNDSLPNVVGVKIKSCRNSFSWTLKCIDCIGVKKVCNVLSGLTNDDSCNFWFWPLLYSTMSISIIPQSISKWFSMIRR